MNIKIKETGEYKKLELSKWNEEYGYYDPDFFDEIFGSAVVKSADEYEEGGDALIMSESEFRDIVEYYIGEVRAYNSGKYSEVFGSKNDEFSDGKDLVFFVNGQIYE